MPYKHSIFSKKWFHYTWFLVVFMMTIIFGYLMGYIQKGNELKGHYGLSFSCYGMLDSTVKPSKWVQKTCNANISFEGYDYTVSVQSNFNDIKFLDEVK